MNLELRRTRSIKVLERVSLTAAMAMAFSFSFSFAIFNIGVAVLMASFLIRRTLEKNPALFDTLTDVFLISYYLFAILSLTNSQYMGMSLQGLHKLIRYIGLFAAARELVTDWKSVKWITAAFAAGGTLAAFDAMSQLVLGRDFLTQRTPFLSMTDLIRVSGSFGNPNMLAIYLSFLIPLVYLLTASRIKTLKLMWLPLILMVASVAFTYSRPAATALVFSGLLIVIFNRIFWLPLLFVALLVPGFFFAPPAVKEWLSQLNSWQNFFYDVSRHYHHLAAWNMIRAHFWTGVGINTFDLNYAHYRVAQDTITRWSAHQAYLQIWAEMGILGFLSFLGIVAGIFRLWQKAYLACRDFLLKQILLGYATGTLGFLIISFFESSLWQPRQTYFFWFFSGVMCGISKWILINGNTGDTNETV